MTAVCPAQHGSRATRLSLAPPRLGQDDSLSPGCPGHCTMFSSVPGFSPLDTSVCLVAQSRPTLCDPMDCSPPGSSVHWILQARVLEWVAVPSSRGSSQPGIELAFPVSPTLAGGFFTTSATWEAHGCQ